MLTSPTPVTDLVYDTNAYELVTAGEASEGDAQMWYAVAGAVVTNEEGDVDLSEDDVKVGNIYTPMKEWGRITVLITSFSLRITL